MGSMCIASGKRFGCGNGIVHLGLETCGAMKSLVVQENECQCGFQEEAVEVYEFVLSTFGCLKNVKKTLEFQKLARFWR